MTMRRLQRTFAGRARGDEGVGLILVIGVSILIFAIAAAAAALAVNGISQSRQRNAFETSLALSETGVDRVLSEVQGAYSDANADYPAPGPVSAVEPSPWCAGTPINFPTAGVGMNGDFGGDEAAERAWARGVLQNMADHNICIQTDEQGQYVVLKPPAVAGNVKYGRVYVLSAIPSFADPKRTRLIKSEYVFMPYRPTHAILTAGPLAISSSTTVTGAAGVTGNVASVHSNSTISGTGNPEVFGLVSSTEPSSFSSNRFHENAGGAVVQQPSQAIPRVSALQFYRRALTEDPNAITDWYDLCPDGKVKAYSVDGVPCNGVAVPGNATTTQVRGWTYVLSTHQWTATTNALSGTYFAHYGSIEVGPGNTSFDKMTLIAEADFGVGGTCSSKHYGNIEWDHFVISAPAYKNLFMFADADIVTHSNFSAGSFGPPVVSGMFVAGDQIHMETSSQGAVGSVLSANQCTSTPAPDLITTSEVKNPSIYFDPNSDAPFSSVITTSLWLDYSGA
ncbi:MAG TPA: hypothetical protein VGK17_10595 [Propionicimonas sp.]|jgi:hypothetical protein